jgi:ubiquitin carboxyl-terminal hydrolase 8
VKIDAQEFLSFLLDALHEDLNRVRVKPLSKTIESGSRPDAEVAALSWRTCLLRHQSIIWDLFCGQTRSHIKCPVCARESRTFDPFFILSLPLPEGRHAPIQLVDCFSSFAQPRTLPAEDGWYCSNCREFREASVQQGVWKAPLHLVIHLKRALFDQPGRPSQLNEFTAPIDGLDLSDVIASSEAENRLPLYDLYGVVQWNGVYRASVRSASTGTWFSCHDSAVGPVVETSEILAGALLLFYKSRAVLPPIPAK